MRIDRRFLVLLGALVLTCAATGMVIWHYPERPEEGSMQVDRRLRLALRQQIRMKMLGRKYRQAEMLVEQAVRISPMNNVYRKILGRIYFETGRQGQAMELFRAMRITAPDDPVLSNNIGMIMLYNRRFEQAINELQSAYRLSGGKPYIAFNLAHAYALAGFREQAGYFSAGFQNESGSTMALPLEALLFEKDRLSITAGGRSIHENIFHTQQVKAYE